MTSDGHPGITLDNRYSGSISTGNGHTTIILTGNCPTGSIQTGVGHTGVILASTEGTAIMPTGNSHTGSILTAMWCTSIILVLCFDLLRYCSIWA